ncbi:telomerase RNA component interacting RNase-like [Oratosquilla oratoria]|uniref:telomerase RNA component interacting RNase-like n=1 Tax=Oratosquilla oratoria TaxID=337810 RepID=UPI003F767976
MADTSKEKPTSGDSNPESSSQDGVPSSNIFRNDGSFMEMFKKMQEQQGKPKQEEEEKTNTEPEPASTTTSNAPTEPAKRPTLSFVGKRRGGRVLPTGMVKKPRKEEQDQDSKAKPTVEGKTDAWSQYMNEVRKYREQSCEEEGKRRPLVK